MYRFILVCLSFFFLHSMLQSQTNGLKRIEELYSHHNNDVLLDSFVRYIKEAGIAPDLLQYENQLIRLKLLKNTKPESYKLFLNRYVLKSQYRKKICIPKNLEEKLKTHPISESKYLSTVCYTLDRADSEKQTKEQNFYCYLMGGNTMIREALVYAITNNDLSVPKQLFYLYCTMQYCKE